MDSILTTTNALEVMTSILGLTLGLIITSIYLINKAL